MLMPSWANGTSRYVLRQRLRNTGTSAKAERQNRGKTGRKASKPLVKEVLASRARTQVHGHPGRGRLKRSHVTPPGGPAIQLSISAGSR